MDILFRNDTSHFMRKFYKELPMYNLWQNSNGHLVFGNSTKSPNSCMIWYLVLFVVKWQFKYFGEMPMDILWGKGNANGHFVGKCQ